jgi:enamine deaminase RidA (YjgF/YER057c/UK114 family)
MSAEDDVHVFDWDGANVCRVQAVLQVVLYRCAAAAAAAAAALPQSGLPTMYWCDGRYQARMVASPAGGIPLSKLSHPKPEGVAPGNGYSHVVTGPGRWVAIAGQVSLDADGKLVGEGDPEAQANQVFANLERCLAAAGATFADVVKLNFYVTDIAFLPAVRTARDEHIDTTNPPASTAVQVVSLFRPEALIEIEAYAVVAD